MADMNDYLARLRRELGNATTVSASEAKNQFGQMLDSAIRDGAVVITKHDAPKAILLSIEEYEMLKQTRRLDSLSAEFDATYARMQQPGMAGKMAAAFNSSPRELGATAVKAARKKR
jgi:antitoxin Phd